MSQSTRRPVKIVSKRPAVTAYAAPTPVEPLPPRRRHYRPRSFLHARPHFQAPAAPVPERHGLVIKRTTALWLLIVAGGAFLLLVFSLPAIINWDALGRAIGPSCTIGIGNAGTKMTVKGWQSQDVCDQVRTNASGITAFVTDGSTANQVEMCQFVRSGSLVTVYGAGSTDLVGTMLCAQLRSNS